MSAKFQITLPDRLAHELKREAARLGIPLAQWIRETMEQQLRQARTSGGDDPLSWMDDLVDSPETDLASRVDEILYK